MRLGIAAALTVTLAGCGSSSQDPKRDAGGKLQVLAATSLKRAFEDCAPGAALSFGGSDELAAQIRQGAKPDVYAAADTKLPAALAAEGRLGPPASFASNELVLAVPRGSPIRSLAGAGRPGVRLVAGQATVPVGAYTAKVLAKLPAAERKAIRANVRSEEPDVGGVVAKVAQGAAQAGFVYRTDVAASGGRLRAIRLDRRLDPFGTYAIGVVRGARRPRAAKAFVADVERGRCHRALVAARFGPPGGP